MVLIRDDGDGVALPDALTKAADCYVICTNHDVFDYDHAQIAEIIAHFSL